MCFGQMNLLTGKGGEILFVRIFQNNVKKHQNLIFPHLSYSRSYTIGSFCVVFRLGSLFFFFLTGANKFYIYINKGLYIISSWLATFSQYYTENIKTQEGIYKFSLHGVCAEVHIMWQDGTKVRGKLARNLIILR